MDIWDCTKTNWSRPKVPGGGSLFCSRRIEIVFQPGEMEVIYRRLQVVQEKPLPTCSRHVSGP